MSTTMPTTTPKQHPQDPDNSLALSQNRNTGLITNGEQLHDGISSLPFSEIEIEQQQLQDPNIIVNTMITANNAFISSLDHLPCDIVRSLWIIQSLNLKADRLKVDISKLIRLKDAVRIKRKQMNGIDTTNKDERQRQRQQQHSREDDDESSGDLGLRVAINDILDENEIQQAKRLIFSKVYTIEKRIKTIRLEVFNEARHLRLLVKNHLNYIESDLSLMGKLSDYKILTASDYNGDDARNWKTFCKFKKEFLKSVRVANTSKETTTTVGSVSPVVVYPPVDQNTNKFRSVTPGRGLKIRLNLNETNQKPKSQDQERSHTEARETKNSQQPQPKRQLRVSSTQNTNKKRLASEAEIRDKGELKIQKSGNMPELLAPSSIRNTRRPASKVTKQSLDGPSPQPKVQNSQLKKAIARPPLNMATRAKTSKQSSKRTKSKAAQATVPSTPEQSSSDGDDESYCFCGGPSFGKMIACDNDKCKREWFHYKCVGLFKAPNDKQKWYCSSECENEATSAKLGKKRRRR